MDDSKDTKLPPPTATDPEASSSSNDPPPPYASPSTTETDYLPVNPGFCTLAWSERRANRQPGGGMTASQYFTPCAACGLTISDTIPSSYKSGWADWVDPSVNFRWESHVAVNTVEGGTKREFLGCWICWEFEEKWVRPMESEEWYAHLRAHFREGFRACVAEREGRSVMQRRRNCAVRGCPKIHS